MRALRILSRREHIQKKHADMEATPAEEADGSTAADARTTATASASAGPSKAAATAAPPSVSTGPAPITLCLSCK